GAGPRPTPARPSTAPHQDPARPDAATHRPRPAAGSEPNPPLRSPIQSVWVASFSTVAIASFSRVVDTYRAAALETSRDQSSAGGPRVDLHRAQRDRHGFARPGSAAEMLDDDQFATLHQAAGVVSVQLCC